jgi:hypothetical protein
MNMRALALLGLVATAMLAATPAAAVDFGIVAGSGATQSNSTAVAGSQGSSASALFGFTTQTSQSLAASGGEAQSIMSGNDQASTSVHQSETLQAGSSASFGLAGSQNSNLALGVGSSSASNQLTGVWLFVQP